MLRPKSADPTGDDEIEAGEVDLHRLQNQFRERKGNRKAVSEETQYTIRKQKALISQLEAEAAEMNEDLTQTRSKRNVERDERDLRAMVEAQNRQDLLLERIRDQTALNQNLSSEIEAVEKTLAEQQRQMSRMQTSQASQKQVRVMENKLEVTTTKLNSLLSANAQLRETIDHLQKERAVFEKTRGRLEKQLEQTKQALGELIDTSTRSYEERDEAQAKVQILQEKGEKEMTQYSMEIKELRRSLENEYRLKKFMATKEKERAESGEVTDNRVRKRDGQTTKTQEALKTLQEAFEQMKESTGIEEPDELVTRFIEVEDQNFALFNYVNELNNNIEQLQDEIAEIRQKMENFKREGIVLEEQRQDIMTDLESELHRTESTQRDHQQRYSKSRQMLDQLKMGISSLFNKIDCDPTAINDLLSGHLGVTDASVMQYLGIIEQRTNELLHFQNWVLAREHQAESEEQTSLDPTQADTLQEPMTVSPGTHSRAGPPSFTERDQDTDFPGRMSMRHREALGSYIIAPSTTDDMGAASSESDEDRPLNQDELRAKVMKSLLRKERKAAQAAASMQTTKAPAMDSDHHGNLDEYEDEFGDVSRSASRILGVTGSGPLNGDFP